MRLSLFFPAYNECENIADSVAGATAVLGKLVSDGRLDAYEIIVVDDGSSDATASVIEALSAADSRVRLVMHGANLGYGAALWSGIQAARYEWVFFTDADLQFKLEEISRLIDQAGFDGDKHRVVLGYRAPRRDPMMRILNAEGWNVLNRVLFGLKVRDIDCAFKMMDRRLVASLPLESRGAAMSAEMLIRMQRAGVTFGEVPVTHLPRQRGSPTGAKLSVIYRAFKELFRLYIGPLGQAEDTAYVQAVKFGIVGVVNTAVDVATYFVLTRFVPYFPTHILTAKFTTFFFGTICSFILNRRFTFSIKSRFSIAEMLKFYSSVAVTVTVNVAALYVLNSVLGIYDLVAVGMSTVFTFIVGFAFSKLWVFRPASAGPSRIQALNNPFQRSFGSLKRRLHAEKIDWAEVARVSNDE